MNGDYLRRRLPILENSESDQGDKDEINSLISFNLSPSEMEVTSRL